MYSLSETIYSASPKYLQYFSRKTGFLISDFPLSMHNNVRWLWKHLSKGFRFNEQMESLSPEESERLFEMLLRTGYSSKNDDLNSSIEQKLPWIFNHPSGGIFIPLEIIKLLMREELFFQKNYLFSLLYRIKFSEQRNFASLMGGSLEGQVSLTFENNPLDMALVLYIWLMDGISKADDISRIIPERGRIIHGPFTFAREDQLAKKQGRSLHPGLLPRSPVPAWDYFYTSFGHLREDIDQLHTLMIKGRKGFYRSLALLKNQQSDLVLALKKGFLIPVIVHSGKNRQDRLKITAPVELHYSLDASRQKTAHPGNIIQ